MLVEGAVHEQAHAAVILTRQDIRGSEAHMINVMGMELGGNIEEIAQGTRHEIPLGHH